VKITKGKIADIEFLRGFGVVFVLLGHTNGSLIPWSSPLLENSALQHFYYYFRGASGVDLFFVISGFVITRDLHPRLVACSNLRSFTNVSLAFWIRRIWRIFPTAWFSLAIILLAAAFFNRSGIFHPFKTNLDGTIAAVFQYYNYHLALCYKHYDCGANFYYWTLSLEEQFYLLLPFSILYLRKWLPYVLACLIVTQIFFPNRSIMMTVFRTDAILLGVMIALWSRSISYRVFESRFLANSRWLRITFLVGLYSTMAVDNRIAEGTLAPFNYGILALICGAFVLIGSYDKNYLFPQCKFKRLIMWLGSRSCSLYMVHIPAYYFVQEAWFRIVPKGTLYEVTYTIPFILSGIGMVFLLGELSYRLVESPSRRKGTQISTRFLQKRISEQTIDQPAAGSSR